MALTAPGDGSGVTIHLKKTVPLSHSKKLPHAEKIVSFSSSPSNRNHNIPLRPGADLSGQVIYRTRRTIQTRMDTSAQIVTYTIMDPSSRRYYVDEFAPDEYHKIGDYIIVTVYVKTFKKNNGKIGHSVAVQQQFSYVHGEHF